MQNNVLLSDDELSVVFASLMIAIQGYDKYRLAGIKLDTQTVEVLEQIEKLYQRLIKEYFDFK